MFPHPGSPAPLSVLDRALAAWWDFYSWVWALDTWAVLLSAAAAAAVVLLAVALAGEDDSPPPEF